MLRLLYIATAVVAALRTWWTLMWAMWGAPTSFLEYLALLGSVGLFIFGLIRTPSKRFASWGVAISLLLVWSYHLPATIYTVVYLVHTIADTMTAVDLRLKAWWPILLLLSLLTASTCFAVRNLLRQYRKDRMPSARA